MLAIQISRNAGDKCKQLQCSELLATNVGNHKFQKCWRQMLAIIAVRNAGSYNFRNADNYSYNSDHNYNYNF